MIQEFYDKHKNIKITVEIQLANPVWCPKCKQPNNCFIGTWNNMTYAKCIKCDIIIMVDPNDHSKIWDIYISEKKGSK
ncbi:hypothetical protein ES703_43518 [subsurface metagenome]